jgi:putative membrane protein
VILRWIVASLHLFALAIGVAAVLARARGLARVRDTAVLRPVLLADGWWAVAAILWLSTGLWRAFGGLEKGTAYYLQHPLFHAKLFLFVVIVVLEMWPMIGLMRWRRALRTTGEVDVSRAPLFAKISYVQLALLGVMVLLATAIARGVAA